MSEMNCAASSLAPAIGSELPSTTEYLVAIFLCGSSSHDFVIVNSLPNIERYSCCFLNLKEGASLKVTETTIRFFCLLFVCLYKTRENLGLCLGLSSPLQNKWM